MGFSMQPGPGPSPGFWELDGSTLFYPLGGVALPSPAVQGGPMGVGTINADGLFVKGHAVSLSGGQISQLDPGVGILMSPNPILTVGTISIADTAVTPGTFGDGDSIPVITVDQQGRITGISVASLILPGISISAGAGIVNTPNPIT